MKKINLFLATSDDLRLESLELSDLIEHLNLILEKQDIHLYLSKWDYIGGNSINDEIEKRYDETLDKSDMSLIIYGRNFGSYQESHLKKAFEKLCDESHNLKKLYVYFQSHEKVCPDLIKFKDSFPDTYRHFSGNFIDVNSLKNDFLLQFQLFQNEYLQNRYPIKIKNSQLTIN